MFENDICGDYEMLTVDNTGAGIPFTSTKRHPTNGLYSGQECRKVEIALETGEIRYRLDGTAPTTTVGTIMEIGDTKTIYGYKNIRDFKAIRTGGTSGELHCKYYYPA